MRHLLAFAGAIALAPILIGCTDESPIGSNDPPPQTALAMRFGDWKAAPASDDIHHKLLPGYFDPDSLVVFFANGELSCDNPFPIPAIDPVSEGFCYETDGAQLNLVVPPALDRASSLDVGDRRLFGIGHAWGAACSGWGWTSLGHFDGVELGARDEQGIEVKLTPDDWSTLGGSFHASWCGAPVPESPPTPALAVPGSRLGEDADPDALYLVLGDAKATCDDFDAPTECSHTWQARIGIPATSRLPVTLSLADLDTHFEASWQDKASCPSYASQLFRGKVSRGEMAVRPEGDGLSVRVTGSSSENVSLDGIYAVTRCP